MATQTAFFDLTKPAGTDPVDITVLNDNFDKIDAQMQLNKENIEKNMVGSTELNDGYAGRVPAPPLGYDQAFLAGSGMWKQCLRHIVCQLSVNSTDALVSLGILKDSANLQMSFLTLRTDVADAQAASVYMVRYLDGAYGVTPIYEGTAADAPCITTDGVLKLVSGETEQTVYVCAVNMLSEEFEVIEEG